MHKLDSRQRTESIAGVTVMRHNLNKNFGQNALVLLNGIGHGHYWGNFIKSLNRPVITLDVRKSVDYTNYPWPLHHAFSLRFDPKGLHIFAPIMRDYKDRVDTALDYLGYDHVDMMGFSWGGMLAIETALSNQQRIGRLVIAASAPGKLASAMNPSVAKVFMSSNRNLSPEVAGNFYGGDIRLHPKLFDKLETPRDNDPLYYIKQLGASSICSFGPQDLQRLHIPTLVISGEDDPIIPADTIDLFKQNLPQESAQYHVEQGGGHLLVMTRPKAIAHRVNNFLDTPMET